MTGITIDDNGKTRVIADITPYIAERDGIVVRLERIYAGYKQRPVEALDPHEELIVELVNRYYQLNDWIARFEQMATRRANIEAGWTLLNCIRKERP